MLREVARRAMLERGLAPDFPPAVLRDVEALHAPAAADDPAVRDLRALPWASIDNDDSRDLDQLTVAPEQQGDSVRILVAIADVDALVRKDSATDRHARHNTTSVYTPGVIFPMLPEKLSTDLTSLNPHEDRLAVVVDMIVGVDGAVEQEDVHRSVVHNHAKLAYPSV